MSYSMDYQGHRLAAEAVGTARAEFIRRTYGHLAAAILFFIGLEGILFQTVPPRMIMGMLTGPYSWLLVMGAFMVVSWVANRWAQSDVSRGLQYAGLALYVVAEAVVFLPLLYIAAHFSAPDVIPKAGALTLAVFLGLTLAVFVTRHDFSYLRVILSVGSFLAFGIIIVSIFLGGGLGLWFAFAMVVLASGFILYQTSNVLHHYRTDQYVAASLALFASVALLFWYILQIMMSNRRN